MIALPILLLAALPELTVTVRTPAQTMPALRPWFLWAGGAVPGLHPVGLARALAPIDPFTPATWPATRAEGPLTLTGKGEAWLAFLDRNPPETWPTVRPRPLPGRSAVTVRATGSAEGDAQADLELNGEVLSFDGRITLHNREVIESGVGERPTARLGQHPDAVLDAVLVTRPAELARVLGLGGAANLGGRVQVLLLADGALLLGVVPARGRLNVLEAELAQARLQTHRLGEGVFTGWPTDPSQLEALGPAPRGTRPHGASLWVTPRRLLASLARRAQAPGPRPKESEVAMLEFALGEVFRGLERLELHLDRSAGAVRVRGWAALGQKNP